MPTPKLTPAQLKVLRIVAEEQDAGRPLTSRLNFGSGGAYLYGRREVRHVVLERLEDVEVVRTESTPTGWQHTVTESGRAVLAAAGGPMDCAALRASLARAVEELRQCRSFVAVETPEAVGTIERLDEVIGELSKDLAAGAA